ncbi:MAG: hypothetical protein AOY29_04405 [Alcanivorax borkumensis]|jgi:hypothetical protein|uniref:Uncharacterized protein n=1 Tax=Alcanivorax borkumensis (strain ATCC 700651 / DSM 11573 / NCIMB 13689 / SK2) TaxID=393595 RepID=Q0VQX2_ALCBS|nr:MULTISPECIES: hypothetical protein [Alcanivorax]OJH06971.1 MAG: hypothetical protein AOY29_04405 [Alcanivorax borkumensis]BAP13892.1 hypothetical protein AS19_10410 [Alcanivorax sp. NBRC 101098]CAL16426.1 hypothetical protein predicted by Glimmer/Critica [Alcanivorax borkumensis SK2]
MQVLQIDIATLAWLLFAAAAGSSLLTLILLGLIGHFWLGPRIERKVDRRLDEGASQLEDRLRRRFMDMLTGGSRDMLRERAKSLARGVGLISGRQQGVIDKDDVDK